METWDSESPSSGYAPTCAARARSTAPGEMSATAWFDVGIVVSCMEIDSFQLVLHEAGHPGERPGGPPITFGRRPVPDASLRATSGHPESASLAAGLPLV